MNKNLDLEALRLHVSGATVQHKSPFDELKELKNENELSQEFIDKWVNPFYMNIGHPDGLVDKEWMKKLKSIKAEITTDVIKENLGNFNWRTRQTGAFFSVITNQQNFIDIIGIHLLKSQVCYAGSVYSFVLASFNTQRAVEYLNIYLSYYLTKLDLWFDQREVMEAVLCLDKRNGTNHFTSHAKAWNNFISNKNGPWLEPVNTERIEKWLALITELK